jgi:hypothetical protein
MKHFRLSKWPTTKLEKFSERRANLIKNIFQFCELLAFCCSVSSVEVHLYTEDSFSSLHLCYMLIKFVIINITPQICFDDKFSRSICIDILISNAIPSYSAVSFLQKRKFIFVCYTRTIHMFGTYPS